MSQGARSHTLRSASGTLIRVTFGGYAHEALPRENRLGGTRRRDCRKQLLRRRAGVFE